MLERQQLLGLSKVTWVLVTGGDALSQLHMDCCVSHLIWVLPSRAINHTASSQATSNSFPLLIAVCGLAPAVSETLPGSPSWAVDLGVVCCLGWYGVASSSHFPALEIILEA